MTIIEAFNIKISQVSEISVPANITEGLLMFEGLDPNAEWNPNNGTSKCSLYKVILTELSKDIYKGVKSVSEGGYSISYDFEGKKKCLSDLAEESGCGSLIERYNTNASITDISDLLNR